jgi:hypothetical protein
MENALKAVALAFGMVAASGAHAEEVLLSCWGTIEVIRQGKQVNPLDEKYFDFCRGGYCQENYNDRWSYLANPWRHFTGNDCGHGPGQRCATLNRITGAANVHFIEQTAPKKFYGECKPAQKLF